MNSSLQLQIRKQNRDVMNTASTMTVRSVEILQVIKH